MCIYIMMPINDFFPVLSEAVNLTLEDKSVVMFLGQNEHLTIAISESKENDLRFFTKHLPHHELALSINSEKAEFLQKLHQGDLPRFP